MGHFKVNLDWKRTDSDFSHESFNRTHQILFSGGLRLEASSAPDYLGDPGKANPEELFLASLASCHMLTFLAISAKARYCVDRYLDAPEATVSKNEAGMTVVSQIKLRPQVQFSGDKIPDADRIRLIHEKAHKYCFIANSVKTEVVVDPQI